MTDQDSPRRTRLLRRVDRALIRRAPPGSAAELLAATDTSHDAASGAAPTRLPTELRRPTMLAGPPSDARRRQPDHRLAATTVRGPPVPSSGAPVARSEPEPAVPGTTRAAALSADPRPASRRASARAGRADHRPARTGTGTASRRSRPARATARRPGQAGTTPAPTCRRWASPAPAAVAIAEKPKRRKTTLVGADHRRAGARRRFRRRRARQQRRRSDVNTAGRDTSLTQQSAAAPVSTLAPAATGSDRVRGRQACCRRWCRSWPPRTAPAARAPASS